MLSVFRENLRSLSWVLYLVIISFIFFFGVNWYDSCRRGRATGDWAALVQGRTISRNMLSWQADLERERNPDLRQLNDRALQALVLRYLEVAEAERIGLRVTDDQFLEAIRYEFTDPNTRAYIGNEMLTKWVELGRLGPYHNVDGFKLWFQEDMMASRWRQQVRDATLGDDVFVQQYLQRRTSRAAVTYLTVPAGRLADLPSDAEARTFAATAADRILRRGVVVIFDESTVPPEEMEISKAEIDDFARRNPEVYGTPGRREAQVILLKGAGNETPTDLLERAQALFLQLRNGEIEFEEAVRTRSAHAATREQGGNLGLHTREELSALDPPLLAAIFGRGVTGDTLGPIQGTEGFWIVRLARIEHPVVPEEVFGEEEEQIRSFLRARRLESASRLLATTFRRQVSTADEAIAQAEQAGWNVREIGPLAEGATPADLPAGAILAYELFSLDTGEVGRVLRLGQGHAVLARTVLAEERPPVEDYLDQARDMLGTDRTEETLRTALETARAAGQGLDAIARQLGLTVQETSGTVGPDLLESTLGSQGRQAALSGEIGIPLGPFTTPQGLVILEVTERPEPSPLDPAEVEQARREIRDIMSSLVRNGILERIREQAQETGTLAYRSLIRGG